MATVSTYLTELADKLTFSESKRTQIDSSASSIEKKLKSYFERTNESVKEIVIFGSYARKTIVSNGKTDVDIMVVFENSSGYKPQTYLNKLKNFAENSYSSSDIKQASPTIKIELNHIIFELVPAYQKYLQYGIKSYFIPSTNNNTFSFDDWQQTEFDFNKKIKEACNNSKNIYRLILLMKSWCSKNNYISSYKLEQYIVEQYYYNCNTLFDYMIAFVDSTNWKVDNKLKVLKDYMDKAKEYKNNGYEGNAIEELKKINF